MGLEQCLKLGLTVERGVVEDDRLAGPKFGHEHLGEPGLDDAAVTVPGEGQRRKHLADTPGGDHRDALGGVAETLGDHGLSFGAVGVGVVKRVLGSSFVHIDAGFRT